ncbi:MAG: hypothetical protein U1F42_09940 [Candidatus Competibacteraceae bacterium]
MFYRRLTPKTLLGSLVALYEHKVFTKVCSGISIPARSVRRGAG